MLLAITIIGILFFVLLQYYRKLGEEFKVNFLFNGWMYFFAIMSILEPVPDNVTIGSVAFVVSLIFIVFNTLVSDKGLYNRKTRNNYEIIYFIVLMFLFWVIISAVIGLYTGKVKLSEATRGLIPFVFLLMVIPFGVYLRNSIELKKVTYALIFSCSLFSLRNLYYFLESGLDNQFSKVLINRITLIDPSTTIPFPLFGCLLSFFILLLKNNGRYEKRLYLTVFIINFFGVAVTLTRSMILTILTTILLFLFLRVIKTFSIPKTYLKYFAILLFFTGLIAVIPSPIQRIINAVVVRFKNVLSGDRNVSIRLTEYEEALNTFLSNPIFGGGIGIPFSQHGEHLTNYIHNSIFYMLANVGVIGLALYLLLFVVILKAIRNFNEYSYSYSAALFGIFMYSQFFASFRLIHNNILIAISIIAICSGFSFSDENPEGEI